MNDPSAPSSSEDADTKSTYVYFAAPAKSNDAAEAVKKPRICGRCKKERTQNCPLRCVERPVDFSS